MSGSSSPSRVYPPPANAMLPPPVPTRSPAGSSSSHSSRNRKLSGADDEDLVPSIASSAKSSTSSATLFSKKTRQKVTESTGGKCWHCGAKPVDACHVVGQKDSSFGTFLERGLLTFDSLEDESNAIPLCPLCHRNFDNANDPGLVFIPTDLQYFIEFEKDDFTARVESARVNGGYVPPRRTPTPEEYHNRLVKEGALPSEAQGSKAQCKLYHRCGLYDRYTLSDYFPANMDQSFVPGLGPYMEPGRWHGAPTAALKRAFAAALRPVADGIPPATINALFELNMLYLRKVETENLPRATQDNGNGGAAGSGGLVPSSGGPSQLSGGPLQPTNDPSQNPGAPYQQSGPPSGAAGAVTAGSYKRLPSTADWIEADIPHNVNYGARLQRTSPSTTSTEARTPQKTAQAARDAIEAEKAQTNDSLSPTTSPIIPPDRQDNISSTTSSTVPTSISGPPSPKLPQRSDEPWQSDASAHGQLLRWGPGSTAESNVVRFLRMLSGVAARRL